MAFDIPNYVTLPIEIGVAILILMGDRRARKRENNAILRFQEQQKSFREAEIKQRERFNNWSQESSKRQIMLLESIMATLDSDKVDEFKNQVGSRYTKEITQDINDLETLLERRSKDQDDPHLEVDIESKIEEIESAKDFVEYFLPTNTINQIQRIADSAKTAYDSLRTLPQTFQKIENQESNDRIPDNTKDEHLEQSRMKKTKQQDALKDFKLEQRQFMSEIEKSIQDSLSEVKDELQKTGVEAVPGKLMEVMKSSFLEKGLKEVMKRSKQHPSTSTNEVTESDESDESDTLEDEQQDG